MNKEKYNEEKDTLTVIAKNIITVKDFHDWGKLKVCLRKWFPNAFISKTRFRSVFVLQTQGDVKQVTQQIFRECSEFLGHTTAVLCDVESSMEDIKEAAVNIALDQIEEGESYCFRIKKRDVPELKMSSREIEQDIGDAIRLALRDKFGAEPRVNLDAPDITIMAEVLGLFSSVGIRRKRWEILHRKIAE